MGARRCHPHLQLSCHGFLTLLFVVVLVLVLVLVVLVLVLVLVLFLLLSFTPPTAPHSVFPWPIHGEK